MSRDRLKRALKKGGALVILDLFEGAGLGDALMSALAIPVSIGLRRVKTGQFRSPRHVREAWAEHGQHDAYPTLSQIHQACTEILPGAEVRRYLLWRYSLIWCKGA